MLLNSEQMEVQLENTFSNSIECLRCDAPLFYFWLDFENINSSFFPQCNKDV